MFELTDSVGDSEYLDHKTDRCIGLFTFKLNISGGERCQIWKKKFTGQLKSQG